MKKDILNNQALNSSLTFFAPSFQRKVPTPPLAGGRRRFGFSMPETFNRLNACRNLGNGKVLITIYHPTAETMTVYEQNGKEIPMKAEGDKYFSAEIELSIGNHLIAFKADGVKVYNTLLPLVMMNGALWNSIDVVDDSCDYFLLQDVPHGSLNMEYYTAANGTQKVCWIYTPASYRTDYEKKYPVLMIKNGDTESETTWIDIGRINYILDNSIASGRAEEMIVLIGYGVEKEDCPPIDVCSDWERNWSSMNLLEEKYRVMTGEKDIVIADLSGDDVTSDYNERRRWLFDLLPTLFK